MIESIYLTLKDVEGCNFSEVRGFEEIGEIRVWNKLQKLGQKF